MPQLLFVDACVRGAESRSRMLAERFLSSYAAANPDAAILRRDLMRDRLEPQYPEVLARRDALAAAGKLDDPLFADAWQFARADRIVLAAPFWELSFPAILKIYLERVSMRDITFGYEESGLVGRGSGFSCGCVGSRRLRCLRAGSHAENHQRRKKQCKQFFHVDSSIKFFAFRTVVRRKHQRFSLLF